MSLVRLAVVGHSGVGKSTATGMLRDWSATTGRSFARLGLAAPLYALQEQVYRAAGVPLGTDAQDQVLLESLARHLRRIRPEVLVGDLLDRLARQDADVVITDDLRDPWVDAPALRAAGFRILRVTCPEAERARRLARRADLSRADASSAAIDLIEPDHVIDNAGDLDRYRAAVLDLVRSTP